MDKERWGRLSLKDRIGHITAEIVRAEGWEAKGESESRDDAIRHALELVDLTLDCYSSCRRRELARLREMLAHCLARSNLYRVSLSDLRRYGMQFLVDEG